MRVIIAGMMVFLLYLLVQRCFARFWDKALRVRVYCEKDHAIEGEELTLIEEIENEKYMILSGVKVKFTTSRYWEFPGEEAGTTTDHYYRNDVFSVGMNERILRRLPFICKKRGYFVLGDVDVFVTDYFYNNEYVKRYKNQQWVYVFAKRVNTPGFEELFRQIMGEVQNRNRLYEDPFTFLGIRDYQGYDSMRRINWKASAKSGELKVNCYDHTAEQSVHIVVFFEQKNVEWDMSMEEYVISMAITMAERFLEKHVAVSLVTNGLDVETKREICSGVGSSLQHLQSIDEAVARIDLSQTKKPLERAESYMRRNLDAKALNIVLTTSQESALQSVLLEKQEEKLDVCWVLPHYEMEPVKVDALLKNIVCDVIVEW